MSRPTARPRRETFIARTADGAEIALTRARPVGTARAVCLCAHAMMARSSYFASAGFADHLAGRGIDVYLLDFRGHGESGSAAPWTFDDLVRFDLPAAVAATAEAAGVEPGAITYLGHSLGGLVGLAGFGVGAAPRPARMALLATSVWLEGPIGWRPRRALRRMMMAALAASGRLSGWVPIRRLRIGSDDEPYAYMAQLATWVRSGRWTSQGGLDYEAALAALDLPVYAATGEGDFLCRPADAERLRAALPGALPLRRVGRRFGDALDPNHFELFTRPALAPFWGELASWLSGESIAGDGAAWARRVSRS
jgi:predicted alpha/beta hydrolase